MLRLVNLCVRMPVATLWSININKRSTRSDAPTNTRRQSVGRSCHSLLSTYAFPNWISVILKKDAFVFDCSFHFRTIFNSWCHDGFLRQHTRTALGAGADGCLVSSHANSHTHTKHFSAQYQRHWSCNVAWIGLELIRLRGLIYVALPAHTPALFPHPLFRMPTV